MIEFLGKLTSFLLLVNCVLYLISFFKFGKAYKFLTFFIVGHTFVEFGMRYLAWYKENNHFLSHFYFLLQFLFLGLFFHKLIKNQTAKQTIKIYFIICISFLAIYFAIQPELLKEFNPLEIFLTSFPLIVYASIYLFEMLTEKKEFYLITIMLIIYLFGSTVVFLFSNIINNYNLKILRYSWYINTVLYFLFQMVLLYEWKKPSSKKIAYAK